MQDDPLPQGVIRNKEGEPIILLPDRPIRSTVVGPSGTVIEHVLHDDLALGRPTEKIVLVQQKT